MIKTLKICTFLVAALLCSWAAASDSACRNGRICAYLDPGTGSFIFQMLIAGFVGGLFALKLFWARVKTFLGELFSKRKKEDEPK